MAEDKSVPILNVPLLTVKQFSSCYSWPSESAMRAYIFRASRYGLEDAFIRVGRRVLIDHLKFFQLLKDKNRGVPDGSPVV